MEIKTLTRADLLDAIYVSCPHLSRVEAREMFELTLEHIAKALEGGDTVNLRAFGRFTTRKKRERVGRNPRTGEAAAITPRRVMTFKPSPRLIQKVNHHQANGAQVQH